MKIMKRSEILLQVDKINTEELRTRTRAGRILRYLLFSFAFAWITLLSSCAVEYDTPEGYYDSFGVYIQPWDYHWRNEHREWIHEHPDWRHEYPHHHHDEDR
jgi:hypothetical protein